MRIMALLFLLWMPLSSFAADEPHTLADVAEDVTANMKELNQYMMSVMNSLADCELDQVCFMNKVDELAADPSNPAHIYWAALKEELDKSKEDIIKYNEKCKVAPAVEARKVVVSCLKQGAERIKETNGEDETFMQQCVVVSMKPLAESGNVFALFAMVDLDSDNTQMWQSKLDEQKASEFYAIAQECRSVNF